MSVTYDTKNLISSIFDNKFHKFVASGQLLKFEMILEENTSLQIMVHIYLPMSQ